MRGQDTRSAILRCIAAYSVEHGYPPSYREIAAAVGLRSPSSVAGHIAHLRAEGLLQETANGRPRASSAQRTLALERSAPKTTRVELRLADGGRLRFDLNAGETDGTLHMRFTGVLDATALRGSVSRIVGCCPVTGDD